MIEQNPARMLANLLTIAKGDTVIQGGGGFGGGLGGSTVRVVGKLRNALDLNGTGGYRAAEVLAAIEWSLDHLEAAVEPMSPRKAERYVNAFSQIRIRLDWEFRDPDSGQQEPAFNVDSLIAEFEHLAIELDDTVGFPQVGEETAERWEGMVAEIEAEIRDSRLDGELRDMLLDAAAALKSAIRELRRFGAAACAERLKGALGRIVGAYAASRGNEGATSLVDKAIAVFVSITGTVEMVGKWKAIPDLIKALDPRTK